MELSDLIHEISNFKDIRNLIDSVAQNNNASLCLPSNSFIPILICRLYEELDRQLILLTSNTDRAEKYYDDIKNIYNSDRNVKIFHNFKSGDLISQEVGSIESLDALRKNKKQIFIFDPESITQSVSIREDLADGLLELKRGVVYKYNKISDILFRFQYEKKDFVFEPGDFAIRGGIVDIFPYIGKHPFRIEFYGDIIESIREFDESSQRSINNIESVKITPNFFNYSDSNDKNNVISFIKKDSLIFIDGLELIDKYFEELAPEEKIKKKEFWEKVAEIQCIKNYLFKKSDELSLDLNINIHPNFNSSLKLCYQELKKYSTGGYKIFLLCDGEKRYQTIKNLIDDFQGDEDEQKPSITYILESVQSGFIFHPEKILVLTEHEIFSRVKRRTIYRKRKIKGFTSKDLDALHRGEYIVHVDYGIGIFEKLQRIRVGESEQECVKLKYLDGDSLFVNLNYINRLKKYNATEGIIPRVNKLGSGEWDRLKSRTKKKIKDIARDLITLYARRKSSEGCAFASDTVWQKELEASFIYEDTPDQSAAVEAVKKDMENSSPMDRLICGDVGYGKTEVAIRAAFKSVMNNKQVAVLVPTTILAEQHYNTFTERLKNFAVNIVSISRFRTQKEQKEIIEKLKDKKLDIIIGTHRLLSKDVIFKDLGLLVIDEEHRFGVTAKEKLRKIKVNVDTLTLTATPIPRTLNFSLMGARDLSIIETPPKNRLPIETEIIKFDDNLIKAAVLKEINRGGQIYFVNDRVNNIDRMISHLQNILPGVRIGVAHGQMKTSQLEKTMVAFLEKKYDILVCTKIIESGLDIPNVNTIFVNRADKFGLAELYQLRGRVGRSNIQAYAYFIIPGFEILSKNAIKRLQAIEEFTELSSGFKLALRDMEIRGVGNFLGAEQSGFVESMGFELYCKILDETVEELKNEEFKDIFDVSKLVSSKKIDVIVEVDVDAYLPETYIADDSERFNYYQRLYEAENTENINEIKNEIIDKYGRLDKESKNLIKIVILRIYLSKLYISKLNLKKNNITLYFKNENFNDETAFSTFNKFLDYLQKIKSISYYLKEIKQELTLNITINQEADSYLDWVLELFKDFEI
jgi:transcription-repair coupling factor (superfamily II helicase)